MSEQPAGELFYERARRIERELVTEKRLTMNLIGQLGERDVEIARLREALQNVVVACDGKSHCQRVLDLRAMALRALERSGDG